MCLTGGGTNFAPAGARLAHTLNTVNLRRVFAVFVTVTAVRMFYALPG
jgi:uncharacterized membrane protein YfcA